MSQSIAPVTSEELHLIMGLRAQNGSRHTSPSTAFSSPAPSSPFSAQPTSSLPAIATTHSAHEPSMGHSRHGSINTFYTRHSSMPNGVNNTPTRPSSQCSNIFSNSSSFSQQLSATHSHGSIGHDDYVSNYSSDSNKSQFTLILQKLDESNKSISMLRDTVQTISVKLGAVEEHIRKLEAMGDRDTDLTRQKKRPQKPEKNLLIASENRTSEQHSVATQLMVRLQRELILYVTDIIPRT